MTNWTPPRRIPLLPMTRGASRIAQLAGRIEARFQEDRADVGSVGTDPSMVGLVIFGSVGISFRYQPPSIQAKRACHSAGCTGKFVPRGNWIILRSHKAGSASRKTLSSGR